MLYPSVKFEWTCCIPSKVVDRKPQFSRNLSKKNGHNLVKILRMTSIFELDLYLMMLYLSQSFNVIDASLQKVSMRNQECDDDRVLTMLRRRHKKRITKALISLGRSAGWSAPPLFANLQDWFSQFDYYSPIYN